MLALGLVALLAWLVDYLAAAVLVKKVGGSGAAATGAGLGAVAGLFAGLPGLILGPVIGATAGQWRSTPDDARQAARVGMAAGLGFVAATVVKGGRDVFATDLPQRVVYVMGAEGEGMDRELALACDLQVSIPGTGVVESLNVASATAVLLAAWRARQRKA